MATNSVGSVSSSRRAQVMIGDLPDDFLRVNASATAQQIDADRQTAAYMQSQGTHMTGGLAQPIFAAQTTRLSITVGQAKLNKNYGLTKMDPYCRVRVGHAVFETHTANGGGKNPIWNKVIQAPLPAGVDIIYLEIFDERSFTMDDRVAWATVPISERITNGETVDDWYPLNGKLGDGQEGTINLVLSLTKVAPAYNQQVIYMTPGGMPAVYPSGQPVVMMPGGVAAAPMYYGYQQPGVPAVAVAPGTVPIGHPPYVPPLQQQQQQPPVPQGPAFTDADVATMKDMFPNIEEEVVRSVLEANRGDKDATINNLLCMDGS